METGMKQKREWIQVMKEEWNVLREKDTKMRYIWTRRCMHELRRKQSTVKNKTEGITIEKHRKYELKSTLLSNNLDDFYNFWTFNILFSVVWASLDPTSFKASFESFFTKFVRRLPIINLQKTLLSPATSRNYISNINRNKKLQ